MEVFLGNERLYYLSNHSLNLIPTHSEINMQTEAEEKKVVFQKRYEEIAASIVREMELDKSIDFLSSSSFFTFFYKDKGRGFKALVTTWGKPQRELFHENLNELKKKVIDLTEDW